MPGVQVELRVPNGGLLLPEPDRRCRAVAFPDVPPGQYVITATHSDRAARFRWFTVRAGVTTQCSWTVPPYLRPPDVQVQGDALSPTDSVQPVSTAT